MNKTRFAAAAAAMLFSTLAFGQANESAPAGPEAQVPASAPAAVWVRGPNVLFDNGPLVNSPGTGAGGADESVLQTTSLGMNTLGFGHQVLNGNRMADDFTVPAGGWLIDSFTFFAYQTGSPTTSTMTAVNMRIWDGVPAAPGSNIVFGDNTTNVMTATAFTNIFRITETTVGANNRPIMAQTVGGLSLLLPPGTYWLDWQTDGSLGSGPWAPPVTITGTAITGNGLQSLADNGATWVPANDTGTDTPQQALPFIITGTLPNADVSIAKTATAPANPVVGDSVTFSLTASNAGPGAAENVVVSDTLPANVTYVSNTCGAAFAAGTVTWTIGALANGATQNCDIATTINNFGAINNTATITTTTTDTNPANDSSTAGIVGVPFPADVAITLVATPAGGLAVGDTFVYTVTGTNNGPGDAAGVLFNLTLSNKVSFVSSDCGAVLGGNGVSWSVPALANGASTSCQITVAVVLGGDINASATVSTTTVDPVVANNSATVVVGFDPVAVPALDRFGLLLAGLLVLGLGLVAVRRF
jgi:uncharacterized repeat protein (TIGR01451 family)